MILHSVCKNTQQILNLQTFLQFSSYRICNLHVEIIHSITFFYCSNRLRLQYNNRYSGKTVTI